MSLLKLIDVGAMGGLQEKWLPFKNLVAPVFFEPNQDEAAKLRAAIETSQVIEVALSNLVGKRALYITENPTCISLRRPNDALLVGYGVRPHFRIKRQDLVQCSRYDVLFEQGHVPTPDFIKLDVQGCEYEVLLGFGRLLDACLGIELETHLMPLYEGQHLLHEVMSLLSDYGFVLRRLDQNKFQNFDGDLVEADAFFTKPRGIVKSYDTETTRKFELIRQVCQLHAYD